MVSKQAVIDVLKEREDFYAERDEGKQMFAIANAIDDVLNLPSVSPWHTGTPIEEGWYLVKYECVWEGRYKGRIGYRAVKRTKDPIDGYIYENGGINADDVWRPIEWQRIEP